MEANKIFSEYSLGLSMFNGVNRQLSIYFLKYDTNTEIFIQIKDYVNNSGIDSGICFKLREFIWFINAIGYRNKPKDLYKNKNVEIFYEVNRVYNSFVSVYQKTKKTSKTSIFLLSMQDVYVMNNHKVDIIKYARDGAMVLQRQPIKDDLKTDSNSSIKGEDFNEPSQMDIS
jgi:hypothetical protein